VQYRPGKLPVPTMLYTKSGEQRLIEEVLEVKPLPMGEYDYVNIVEGCSQHIYRSGNSWFERCE
ncbi:MAG: hypothetical protein ACK5LL_07145, partial [Suipraeoptans sp.]